MGAKSFKTGSKMAAYHLFIRAEDELLIELKEVELVLRFAGLGVDGFQELANDPDDLRQYDLVRVVLWRVLEYSLEQERIPSQTRCWFRQVAVQLQFS